MNVGGKKQKKVGRYEKMTIATKKGLRGMKKVLVRWNDIIGGLGGMDFFCSDHCHHPNITSLQIISLLGRKFWREV